MSNTEVKPLSVVNDIDELSMHSFFCESSGFEEEVSIEYGKKSQQCL